MKVEECIVSNELRPTAKAEGLWASIITDQEVKDRLFRTALLGLRLRPELPFTTTALHGLALLYGPPGTGKTTLARGLADELGPVVPGGKVRLVEVNPHGLMSAEHGQSQQLVMQLLCDHVPALADDGKPTVVLLDEVEAVCVARSTASLSANPVDVHRATDAVLTALDLNTAEHPHIITVATSNFTDDLDEAFKSRAARFEAHQVAGPEHAGVARPVGDVDLRGQRPANGRRLQFTIARRLHGHAFGTLLVADQSMISARQKGCRRGDLNSYSPPPQGFIVGPELWLPAA